MKTFDKRDIFTGINAEEAKNYIGKKGYFGDSLSLVRAMVDCNSYYTLIDIDADDSAFRFVNNINHMYCFFLPTDKVKEVKEKKWRAFTLEEFLNKFFIGTKISFRRKDETRSVYGLFEGYQTDVDRIIKYQIIICNLWYTLKELFENYEYLDEHGEWQPFGVLDES